MRLRPKRAMMPSRAHVVATMEIALHEIMFTTSAIEEPMRQGQDKSRSVPKVL